MERLQITARADFGARLEAQGLSFHSWDNYWKEDVCYGFSLAQIEEIETAAETLHRMCVSAMRFAVLNNRLGQLGIPSAYWDDIAESVARDDFSLYGRFDLAYDGKSPPKMLEYNADTPTSLLESGVCQWYWLTDVYPTRDQFNSLHEKLVEQWKLLPGDEAIYVASISDNEEDWVCAHYVLETITQAGRVGKHIYIEGIGWDEQQQVFVDTEGEPIRNLFKLYPWEWLMREEFGQYIAQSKTRFIEPMWKSVMSCKGLLAILWELYPNHPNLLETYFEPRHLQSYANVQLVRDGQLIAEDDGPYGDEGFIYQALCTLPEFAGRYPVIGAWVVGDQAAGMCMREDVSPITTNMSNFVPHFFMP